MPSCVYAAALHREAKKCECKSADFEAESVRHSEFDIRNFAWFFDDDLRHLLGWRAVSNGYQSPSTVFTSAVE
jgi:hypothetical protein